MWWIEDRGISNGLYVIGIDESDIPLTLVSTIDDAVWISAIWKRGVFFTSDRTSGEVFKYDIGRETPEIAASAVLASPGGTRGVAYYYGPPLLDF